MTEDSGDIKIPRWFIWVHGATAPLLIALVVTGVTILFELKTELSILNTRIEYIVKAGEDRTNTIASLQKTVREMELELATVKKELTRDR